MPARKLRLLFFLVALVGSLLFNLPVSAQEADAETSVVHAVFFYSPTCSHCHDAINNVLIPLMAEYGERLAVVGIDVSTEAGNYLYSSAILFYEVPENRRGVPTLVVADTVLVSSLEIENAFPQMVEAGLEAGGNEWPAFPGMAEVAASLTPTPESALPTTSPTPETAAVGIAEVETAVPPTAAPVPADTTAQSLETIDTTTMSQAADAPPPDPVGFALGWLVLLGLLVVLLVVVWQAGGHWVALTQADAALNTTTGRRVLFWLLIGLGLLVSGYLAYVETTQIQAVCGPVGECNVVQSSPYAQIMGIPIAVFGLLFYLALAGLWLAQRFENASRLVAPALVALTLFGVLFSLYLTLLELLVIGAICAWCLASAVVTGLLSVLVTRWAVKRPLPSSNLPE